MLSAIMRKTGTPRSGSIFRRRTMNAPSAECTDLFILKGSSGCTFSSDPLAKEVDGDMKHTATVASLIQVRKEIKKLKCGRQNTLAQ